MVTMVHLVYLYLIGDQIEYPRFKKEETSMNTKIGFDRVILPR